jgi:hypothetical protein
MKQVLVPLPDTVLGRGLLMEIYMLAEVRKNCCSLSHSTNKIKINYFESQNLRTRMRAKGDINLMVTQF